MQKLTKTWALTESTIQAIRDDGELYGKVAKSLNIKGESLPKLLNTNSPNLTRYACLFTISKHLGIPQRKLVTEAQEMEV